MKTDDYELKQAIASVAKLGGYTIKRVATSDDLKDRTLTITITRVSEGHHQERLPFEDVADQVAVVDGNGHVESVNSNPGGVATKVTTTSTLAPSDLTEKDETLTDPDEKPKEDADKVVDLNSKKRR